MDSRAKLQAHAAVVLLLMLLLLLVTVQLPRQRAGAEVAPRTRCIVAPQAKQEGIGSTSYTSVGYRHKQMLRYQNSLLRQFLSGNYGNSSNHTP